DCPLYGRRPLCHEPGRTIEDAQRRENVEVCPTDAQSHIPLPSPERVVSRENQGKRTPREKAGWPHAHAYTRSIRRLATTSTGNDDIALEVRNAANRNVVHAPSALADYRGKTADFDGSPNPYSEGCSPPLQEGSPAS